VASDLDSVLILAHNKAPYVEAAIDSVMKHSAAPFELILVDNGSGPEVGAVFDAAEKRAAEAGTALKRLRFQENIGAIRGRNEGLALAEGDFVAWVDNDCLVRTKGWLARLRRFMEDSPDVGIVGPKLVYPWEPHNIQCAGCDVTRSGRVVFRGRGEPKDDERFGETRDCPTLISACWLMRAELWTQLGPLDEQFSPVQFEDIDYCYRARAAGWRVVYLPSVEMYHFEGMTTVRTDKIDYSSVSARNAVKFKRKWRETIQREGGIDDRGVTWLADNGYRPIEDVGVPEVVE